MIKVYEWECPICRRIIHSTYKKQFDYNKEQHLDSHKRGSMPSDSELSIEDTNKPLTSSTGIYMINRKPDIKKLLKEGIE